VIAANKHKFLSNQKKDYLFIAKNVTINIKMKENREMMNIKKKVSNLTKLETKKIN